jgi:nucleoside-diphosphate-sugar epimerase
MTVETGLTVAVTGPTGTFGSGLVPLLELDHRVDRVVGVARSPFDPAAQGWSKMDYRQGDVTDETALRAAFEGADVVVHLAFLIVGGSSARTRATNVEGTLNAFRAAAEAGVRRFVYASSVAAYGFHADNPVGITEDWPVRPAERLFYAQQKAEIETLLAAESERHPDVELYVLRPSIVAGPHAIGGKMPLPSPLAGLLGALLDAYRRAPLRVPAPVPDIPVQLVHESDVGEALVQCIVAAGPAGAYNIAADDLLSSTDVAEAFGLLPVRVPGALGHLAARAVAKLPLLPSTAEWVEAVAHPAVMDTTKAKTLLGWLPRHTAREALAASLD